MLAHGAVGGQLKTLKTAVHLIARDRLLLSYDMALTTLGKLMQLAAK